MRLFLLSTILSTVSGRLGVQLVRHMDVESEDIDSFIHSAHNNNNNNSAYITISVTAAPSAALAVRGFARPCP